MLSLKIALFDEEYATILPQNMVPYYSSICYHILLQFGTIFFIKKACFQRQFRPSSFSISPFLNFKKATV